MGMLWKALQFLWGLVAGNGSNSAEIAALTKVSEEKQAAVDTAAAATANTKALESYDATHKINAGLSDDAALAKLRSATADDDTTGHS